MTLSEEQIAALAPDPGALKSGRDLAKALQWTGLGHNDRGLWGMVQGSGKDPYRTAADLENLAFQCSCPSRKFPCKHGLGLLLLHARQADAFSATDAEPDWVRDWLDKRREKAAKSAAPEQDDEETQKKRAASERNRAKTDLSRVESIGGGIHHLEIFLKDILREGLIALPEKGAAFFDDTAAAMVDAKASGLCQWVWALRDLPFYDNSNAWHQTALDTMARAWLLVQAFHQREQLPDLVCEDILAAAGKHRNKKDVIENPEIPSVEDHWLVVAKRVTQEEREVTGYWHWLYGTRTQRTALVLEFAFRDAGIQTLLPPGTVVQADLAFYPSNFPQRAALRTQGDGTAWEKHAASAIPLADWAQQQRCYAEQLSACPWLDAALFYVKDLRLVLQGPIARLVDATGHWMPLQADFPRLKVLEMLALSGGNAFSAFVLRRGSTVLPLGMVLQEGGYVAL